MSPSQPRIPVIDRDAETLPTFESAAEKVRAVNDCEHPTEALRCDPDAPMPGGAVLCLECGDVL